MKQVLFGARSVLLGDEAADALLDYAVHVVRVRTGDHVDLRGYSDDGREVTVTLVLDPGVVLAAVTTDVPFEDRDNGAAIAYMRERMLVFDPFSRDDVEHELDD